MKKGTVTEKSNVTRSKILKSALELFREKGFEKTTMRAIAKKGGVALGSAYYYFKTKDEFVLVYYAQTQVEASEYNEKIISESTDFKKRFDALLTFKFDQMKDDRSFVSVLAKGAADRENPLSPFSPKTQDIRQDAIQLIKNVINGSNLKVAKSLRPHLPHVLWLFEMGLILFWINDKSSGQSQTYKLKETSLNIMLKLMQMSTFPLMTKLNQSIIQLIQSLEAWTD